MASLNAERSLEVFGHILSVEEREQRCYDYFNQYNIFTKTQLKDNWKTNPIEGVEPDFVKAMFSDFLKYQEIRENKKLAVKKGIDFHQTFVLSDLHIPFHDVGSLRNVFDCIVDYQPRNLVLCGDTLDCYSISRFSKNPERCRNIQYEIDVFYRMMRELKKHIPNTNCYFVGGNHELRLEKLLFENPGLYGLRVLDPENLFRLKDLGFEYHKIKCELDGVCYYHGDKVRSAAGNSAKAEYEDHRMTDGVSGHTHRLGSYYSTYNKEMGKWYENGCLCKLEPDYLADPDKANWQQGFTIISSFDGLTQGTQIPIQRNMFECSGHVYK